MNDSYNSVFQSLVKQDFPGSDCDFIISVRGGTGCWYYQEKENFRSYVSDLAPDLLIIGGVSNPHEGDWENAIGKVIEQAKELDCEIVLATPPLCYDWRTPDPQNSTQPLPPVRWSEETLNCKGGKSLQIAPYRKIAEQQDIPLWELTSCCADYLAASGKPIEYFNRDYVHNNDSGKQIIGRVLRQCFKQICK